MSQHIIKYKSFKNITFIFFISLLLFSCHTSKNEVVVYTSVDQVFSEPILKDFEKTTGIKVKALYDTEETKSTGVLNRLIAEKNNPQADVFWSGDPARSIVLKNKGITQKYLSSIAQDIDSVFKDPLGHWTGFSARARVLIYNKNKFKNLALPQSIFDLAKPEYKGQVAIANPLFGTTTFHIAAIFSKLGDHKAQAFMKAIKNNDVVIASSNGDVKKRVLQGAVSCGLTDTDDAFEAKKEDSAIDYIFLDQKATNAMGSLIIPNTVCLIKDAPNETNGKKLIDFLLSRDTEAKLAQSCAQMPLHKNVKTPKNVPSLDHIKPMRINYNQTANKLESIQKYLRKWLGN